MIIYLLSNSLITDDISLKLFTLTDGIPKTAPSTVMVCESETKSFENARTW